MRTKQRVSNPKTAEALSDDGRSDEKGGGSLDETASKSHHRRERAAQGISSIIAEVQGVARKASQTKHVAVWTGQQRDGLNAAIVFCCYVIAAQGPKHDVCSKPLNAEEAKRKTVMKYHKWTIREEHLVLCAYQREQRWHDDKWKNVADMIGVPVATVLAHRDHMRRKKRVYKKTK